MAFTPIMVVKFGKHMNRNGKYKVKMDGTIIER